MRRFQGVQLSNLLKLLMIILPGQHALERTHSHEKLRDDSVSHLDSSLAQQLCLSRTDLAGLFVFESSYTCSQVINCPYLVGLVQFLSV